MTITVKQVCTWNYDPDDYWETECGHTHVFIDGGPDENEYRFCPYCGKTLIHNPLEQEDA